MDLTGIDDGAARPGPSDPELIAAVRGGDAAAYGLLYERHSAAAYGLARQLTPSPSTADDLVAEAFAKVLETLRNGRGPDSAFRAYLLTTLRHGLYDNTRRDKRLQFSDDLTSVDPGTPFIDTPMRDLEASLVARAYAALPERWQTVLWHTEIEGQKPADVAPLLGLTANGAAALAYRAREGLRQAYLQAHLAESAEDDCRYTVERLGAWARDGLAKRDRAKVDEHLDTCDRCRALAGELTDVNNGLRAVIAPLVLGAPFVAGYLASLQLGAGTAAAAATSAASGPSDSGSVGGGTGAGGGTAGPNGSGARRSRNSVLAAVAALVLMAGIGTASYAITRSDGDGSLTAAAQSSASTPAPATTQASASPTAPPASASPTSTPSADASPTDSPPTDASPTEPGPTEPGPTEPGPSPSSPAADEPSAPDDAAQPPAAPVVPLSVAVSFVYGGQNLGQSGTLSGAVGSAPQVRLLDALPPGWSVDISGPCQEGGGAVCTLSGAQGSADITVTLTPPASATGQSVSIGLFAEAADTTPVDSF